MHYSARDDITYGEAAISLSRCLVENVGFILTFLIFWPKSPDTVPRHDLRP